MMGMRDTKKGIALLLFAAIGGSTQAQLVLDNTITVDQLVQNVLLGGGVTVTNVTFNGVPGNLANIQIGSFNGTNCNVGMGNGITLSSGDINVALGPNDTSGDTEPAGGIGGPNDTDLDLASNSTTFDRAVLEFDFVPAGDSLSFNYVFGSEEYLEWVSAGFNDVFGFFLSGPGISGPYSNNAANIALVPGTAVPVSIDNVNDVNNSTYYVDNGDGFTPPYNGSNTYIQYDGFTVVLTATALVQCGQTYHIKLAIADAGDPVLDSSVFLEGGSFSSPNAIDLEVVTASADGTLTEGCTDAIFTITRPGSSDSIDVTVVVSGTATNGTDYTSIPIVITIPDGVDSVSFPIEAFEDNIGEGQETIILTATFVNACGDTSVSSATVPIVEYVPMIISTQDLLLQCEDDSVLISAQVTGGFGALSPVWQNGVAGWTDWVPGMENGEYIITVSDECDKSITATVNVESGCQIIIPNVFSPNGDGENDFFTIEGILGTSNTVKIFNRWGQVVFEANQYRNQWDGDEVSDGTYFYEVVVQGEPKPFTGHLTILNNKR